MTNHEMKFYQEIAYILLEHWDPIGIKETPDCQDEYDSYAHEIYQLVTEGNDTLALAKHLTSLTTNFMALPPNSERDIIVAEKILEAAKASK